MAIVNIKGTVTRTFYKGLGAEVTEKFKKRDGGEGETRWACWFDTEHGLAEGAVVKVSGVHGAQVDEWQGREGDVRHSVKLSINGSRIATGDAVGDSQPVSTHSATDTRSTVATPQTGAQSNWDSNDDLPF
jgi:hypothetical protein